MVASAGAGCADLSLGEPDPYRVGERGNLRFFVTEMCGFVDTCEPDLPQDAPLLGIESRVYVVANSDAVPRDPLPVLDLSSADPAVFTVTNVICTDDSSPPMHLPCPTDPILAYSVDLQLNAPGRVALVARLADGSVYDRGEIIVEDALCSPEPRDARCP